MKTYPTYPQPIIQHPNSGFNWFLEVTPGGTLRAGGTTIDAPTTLNRLKLVDPTGQAAYRLGLDVSDPPLITATVLSAPRDAGYQDLSVWGINGREWNLRVTSAGSITVNAISTNWPMADQPIFLDSQGRMWHLNVSDAGITEAVGPTVLPLTISQTAKIRADDDSASFEITVNDAGILFVSDPADVSLATHYEILLTSPGGLRFPLAVDANGILSIDTAMAEIEARDSWPLVLQSRTNILYVVDNRFRPPTGSRGGYGHRRRG